MVLEIRRPNTLIKRLDALKTLPTYVVVYRACQRRLNTMATRKERGQRSKLPKVPGHKAGMNDDAYDIGS